MRQSLDHEIDCLVRFLMGRSCMKSFQIYFISQRNIILPKDYEVNRRKSMPLIQHS